MDIAAAGAGPIHEYLGNLPLALPREYDRVCTSGILADPAPDHARPAANPEGLGSDMEDSLRRARGHGAPAGDGQSVVYKALQAKTGKLPRWNFGKYVVSRDGRQAEFFDSKVTPDGKELREAIERALAAK